jgi:Tol biopolymer transport system component
MPKPCARRPSRDPSRRFRRFGKAKSLASRAAYLLALCLVVTACAPSLTPPPPVDLHITIAADGSTTPLTTQALTVRDALNEAGIVLGERDRITPSEFTPLVEGMAIKIVRLTETFEVEEVIVPFSRRTVRNEGLQVGQTRLLQTGQNGIDEITYRTAFEDGVQVSRDAVRRVSLQPPVDEIVMVGAQTTFTAIQIDGTLAYISAGSAWLMRDSSGSRRPLVTSGDLDRRVFSLSPDGRYLLYTRSAASEGEAAGLNNSLWAISATEPNPRPIELGVENVLWADWSPTEPRTLAYSTGEPRSTAPGWQANNDLYLLTFDTRGDPDDPLLALEPSSGGLYGWFGTNFAWSPDGARLAFSQSDQLGIVDPENQSAAPIAAYAIFQTYSDWVWNPSIAWSPDGQFIYTVLHGPPLGLETPEDSRVFDLAVVAADGSFDASLVAQAGIWANPLPSPDGQRIAYLQATTPLESINGTYRLAVMDRDGSNAVSIFPALDEPGLKPDAVTYAWSPESSRLAVILDKNLWVVEVESGKSQQLSGDGQTSNPSWIK